MASQFLNVTPSISTSRHLSRYTGWWFLPEPPPRIVPPRSLNPVLWVIVLATAVSAVLYGPIAVRVHRLMTPELVVVQSAVSPIGVFVRPESHSAVDAIRR